MKRVPILILLLFMIQIVVIGQNDWEKFEKIKGVKSNDVKELSEKITKEYPDELDKIKAIYYWVAHNIRYDYGIVEKREKNKGKREKFTKEELKKKRQEEINTAIRKRKGVCQHYSLIFEELCLQSKIESKFIGGKVKTGTGRTNSHAWNAVKYKDEWKLIDVTYGSGGLNEKEKFVLNFDPNYFFVDQEVFSINHFPKDKEWQLLEREIEEEEFKSYLNIGTGYIEYDIKSLNKKEYKIKLAQDEALVLEFKTNKPIENLICYKPTSGKRINIDVSEDNLNYKIKIDSSKIRNGYYNFTSGKKLIFSYKIERN